MFFGREAPKPEEKQRKTKGKPEENQSKTQETYKENQRKTPLPTPAEGKGVFAGGFFSLCYFKEKRFKIPGWLILTKESFFIRDSCVVFLGLLGFRASRQ